MNLRIVCLLGACGLMVGCGSTTLSLTGPQYPAREPTCDFEVFTSTPGAGFTEIGTIDVKEGEYAGSNVHTDVADLKQEIRPHVCKAGGDAVLAYANGDGEYIKASVLKRVEPPAAPATDAPAASAPAAPAADAGCQYDTQCKGERVCVSGQCVDPQPSAAAAAAPAPTSTVAPSAAPAK